MKRLKSDLKENHGVFPSVKPGERQESPDLNRDLTAETPRSLRETQRGGAATKPLPTPASPAVQSLEEKSTAEDAGVRGEKLVRKTRNDEFAMQRE